ncbi:MAG: DUF368 domain-containing protein [Fusobacteriaceae bacterium]|nr:DUF368 domain-containing protein [Fusobacteriaceae bacterium]MBN2838623.1 DUF368 domain-containing protein [Fusobacteriaceae bacterium]
MLKLLFSGIAIGIANIIPGVSGGTIAFILGIYDKLTEAIGNFILAPKSKKIEYLKFLLPLFFGVGIGILLFAKVIEILYLKFPEPTSFFFIGLILASLPIILKENKDKFSKSSITAFIFGAILVLIFLYFKKSSEILEVRTEFNLFYYIKLLLCGIVGAGAMIIPGISGSMLLLILGEYYNILSYVNKLKIIPLVFVGIGVIIGIVLFSKLIAYFFSNFKNITISFITGLIIASIKGIWPGVNSSNFFVNLFSLCLGCLVVYISEKITLKKNKI